MDDNGLNAGIYIHVPFCRQACTYCNFHFSTSVSNRAEMTNAIISEIESRKNYLDGKNIGSIYFGGGTPSLLDTDQIKAILNAIHSNFLLTEDPEITLEANPDDLDPEKISGLKESGINRLSIGIQSFDDRDLIWMNRAHNSAQSFSSIENSINAGFNNLTIDLIYGIPGQEISTWKKNLEIASNFTINHLSCYALTVEPKTKLDHLINQNKIEPVSDIVFEEEFNYMADYLASKQFEQYEISNFARHKKYAVHNSSYWKGAWYLGVGPSAHSFNGVSRQWNIANNAVYLKAIADGENYSETEILSEQQKYNEYVMTSLRTIWGVDTHELKSTFSESLFHLFEKESKKYLDSGHLILDGSKIIIAAKGKMIADGIISDLFFV